ncbi:tRNA (N6-isopentenyl adenosine(37)-C2)-methylthiotransferase MiaB [Sedimentibacter sp. zth1]|uniref:tRNA (N6-isopentenyl adenosine(37)-C2)-methylthiotransferase MiaB n=1 Tax=Sedimentibacter sp. zth1 TaxID=2816908 RepID=UPI001A920BCA|nr:tRNA (N6-isopentenyl adenosine(37)-C2)-methylthiotransferase MiaB [Sedimentibacter sp. zth1]QSX06505.1 tRNA (N6-isopentenyl adenosine(37)-C2)-methylthiotransferase MiaB [Sedimentibacter sp. zth1]
MSKTFHILTYGCQMNEHDSEKICGMLNSIGYKEIDNNNADLVILNTCLIRENAAQKVFGKLGELKGLKRNNPNMLISVCGCMMQKDDVREKTLKQCPFVDIIFGTNNIHELPELIKKAQTEKLKAVHIIENTVEIHEEMPKVRKYKHKALINITYGCNNFCTYCVVPYTRGREKSREPEDILAEIKDLASNGCKEVTLLGQNVNSYGNTLSRDYSFADLLYDINKIDGIEFIRFMTSHPKDLSDDLIKAIKECDKICNHVHLPVQSGSTKVLNEMNRRYTKEHYLGLVEKIRREIPDAAITTDIIIGFPGETEEDFLETVDLVKKVKYESAFTFLYSIREGTKAATMENQIPDDIKHDRFNRLLEELYPIVLDKNKECIGKTYRILIDGVSKNSDDYLTGRSEHFRLVHFKGDKSLIGKIVNVKIDSAKTFFLEGTIQK